MILNIFPLIFYLSEEVRSGSLEYSLEGLFGRSQFSLEKREFNSILGNLGGVSSLGIFNNIASDLSSSDDNK